MNTSSNYDKIAKRAYQIWEKSGRQQGKENEYWLQAETEINREELQRGGKAGLSPEKTANAGGGRRVFSM